jgi:hypothetical protein
MVRPPTRYGKTVSLSFTRTGAYTIAAGISVHLLLKHGQHYRGRRVTLAYTTFMSILTTVWYIAGSRTSAFQFVDSVFDQNLDITCSATLITTKVTAMLQIFGSDGALVCTLRLNVGPLSHTYLTAV